MNRLPTTLALLAAAIPLPAQDKPPIVVAADPLTDYEVVDAFVGQAPFDRPIHLDHHPADPEVYYVVEQYGRIFRIPRDGAKRDRVLFLDWSKRCLHPKSPVAGNNEEGLLGFAFDPAFAKNGFVYLYYSAKTGEQKSRRSGKMFPRRASVISRLATKDGVADPGSELEILKIPQPYGNHNGGTIVFGPDEMLYVALGDGGLANDPHQHGQNLNTLLGSILRIDVRGAEPGQPYRIPQDNPFAARNRARGEIWAYGLRNPWRINFDRKTGDLWCADVGQNIWEEVDRIVKGGNYGWNKMEGTHPFPPGAKPVTVGVIPPVIEYHHRDGISITGGQVYRGEEMPELVGHYIYADYVSGRLWALKEDRQEGKHHNRLLVRRAGAVASFAEGPSGELFILRYDGNTISRLRRKPTRR